MAISSVPDPEGSGRVDVLTSPVAAARAAVATGERPGSSSASCCCNGRASKHDMYLIRGNVGAQALFLPMRRRIKKKKKGAMVGNATALPERGYMRVSPTKRTAKASNTAAVAFIRQAPILTVT